jgi:hypothetical protein
MFIYIDKCSHHKRSGTLIVTNRNVSVDIYVSHLNMTKRQDGKNTKEKCGQTVDINDIFRRTYWVHLYMIYKRTLCNNVSGWNIKNR